MIPAPRTLSTASGLLMVAAVTTGADGAGLIAALVAAAAVGGGIWLRPVATLAVLIAALAILLGEPPLTLAAVAGLAATAYLVLRHGVDYPTATGSVSTVCAAAVFTLATALAAVIPVRLAWLPLLAPAAVVASYLLAVHPLRTRHSETVSYWPSPSISTRS